MKKKETKKVYVLKEIVGISPINFAGSITWEPHKILGEIRIIIDKSGGSKELAVTCLCKLKEIKE